MPVPEDNTRLFDAANAFLAYVVDAALDAGIDLPTRQIVTTAAPVEDCEQVSVTIRTVTTGIPGSLQVDPAAIGEYFACDPMWTMAFDAAITRCIPTINDAGEPPSPTQLLDAAEVSTGDAIILMEAVSRRAAERLGAVLATVSFAEFSGGMGTTSVAVQMVV
jgi:hypothetical protein